MDQRQAERLYQRAIHAHQSGRLEEAEAHYRKILKVYPLLDPVHSNLGAVLHLRGRHDQALRSLDQALRLNPTNMDAHANRAAVLMAMGQTADALQAYRQLAAQEPKNATTQYNLANLLYEQGATTEAEAAFRQAISLNRDLHQASFNLGVLLSREDRLEEARAAFLQCLAVQPGHPGAQTNLGNVQLALGDRAAALQAYDDAIDAAPGYALAYRQRAAFYLEQADQVSALADLEKALELEPEAAASWVLKGQAHRAEGQTEAAQAAFEQALVLDPNLREAKMALQQLLAGMVPAWHFTMLADKARNEAYQQAIDLLAPGRKLVLDIGAGSGLLAMMAARAGASRVVGCEVIPAVAAAAQDIVRSNGLAEQVRIEARHSGQLDQQQLGGKADLILHEVFDAGLLGEGVLPALRHAMRELAADNAVLIPSRAKVWAVPVEMPVRRAAYPVGQVAGFDLSGFNRFQDPDLPVVVKLRRETHQLLAEPVVLEAFDFAEIPPEATLEQPVEGVMEWTCNQAGSVQGIAIWFELELAPGIHVQSGPGGTLRHWGQAVYFLRQDHPVEPGDSFELPWQRTDTAWLMG